ncbi:hypothetical protein E3E36_03720 [Thermococcus sp. M36]|uniref:hypothetical protein n=1 Tax=Thermococcus sp. M36 TaxID=1638261 RepID=UPI00143975B8|nr:hypothetical protein [Thermococcus sp. M36]NJE05265.1 hypothetical protein [Thermococcus sp. M36]
MVFSISGRKTVLFRRTHASPFVDYNKRSADMIVVLLGNNTTKSLELLQKYGVKYVYVDKVAINDILWVPLEYSGYLRKNGIPCRVEYIRYDPADSSGVKIRACVARFGIGPSLKTRLVPVFQKDGMVIYKVPGG